MLRLSISSLDIINPEKKLLLEFHLNLRKMIHLSLVTSKLILQSAIGGMVLSMIGMGFAAAGFISPVVGAILQEIIDVIAILNALRLIWGNQIETDFIEKT